MLRILYLFDRLLSGALTDGVTADVKKPGLNPGFFIACAALYLPD